MFWIALGVELIFGGLLTWGLMKLTVPEYKKPLRHVPRTTAGTITYDSDTIGMV